MPPTSAGSSHARSPSQRMLGTFVVASIMLLPVPLLTEPFNMDLTCRKVPYPAEWLRYIGQMSYALIGFVLHADLPLVGVRGGGEQELLKCRRALKARRYRVFSRLWDDSSGTNGLPLPALYLFSSRPLSSLRDGHHSGLAGRGSAAQAVLPFETMRSFMWREGIRGGARTG